MNCETKTKEQRPHHRVFAPATDIFETKEAITILADMPGVDDRDLDITLDKNILRIYGKVTPAEPKENLDLAYSEFDTGDFERSFALSSEIDRDKIEAVLKNGVLRLTLQKSKQQEPRKITVKTNQ